MSPTLFEDFNNITAVLSAVLDDYVDTCAKLRDYYFQERVAEKLDEVLDRVAAELQLVTSYGTKLKQAEASMKVVRNNSPTIVPISSLPPETLTRIFQIVVDNQPEILDATRAPFKVSLSFPKYPETLSHVCFGWRQIAIGSHGLWTRIDLVLHHPFGPGLLARAKNHAALAGSLPLDVRMIDPTVDRDRAYGKPREFEFEDFDFLAFAETPISGLSLVCYHGLQVEHYNFIGYCIMNGTEQTLEQFVIRDVCGRGGPYYFLESRSTNHHGRKGFQIDLSEQILDRFWSSTSVLRLAGLYPHWTSRAYHQLVDLRLGSDEAGSAPISEAQIIGILRASPGLRIFHLYLEPTDPLPDDAPISVVRLDELESLNLSSITINPSQILRFLTPGQNSLQLSIGGKPTEVVEQFLRRSNVTQLRMVAWETYPPANLLCLCPNLRLLVLDVWGNIEEVNFQTTLDQEGEGAPAIPTSIQSLYVLRCEGLGLADLQQTVKRHSVQKLTLWRTYPKVRSGSSSRNAYKSEISALCPVVNFLEGRNQSPMDNWDHF
ncbi:hypothetical protein FRC11_015074 [Ceratobasidium sp. 423]|nr:hypothetical protein FRC11_015074 [Ceratobasidium sp. 423]